MQNRKQSPFLSLKLDGSCDQGLRLNDRQEFILDRSLWTMSSSLPRVGRCAGTASITVAACLALSIAAQAQSALVNNTISKAQTSTQAEVEQYWTSDRLLNAKPFNLEPRLAVDGRPLAAAVAPAPKAAGKVVKVPGSQPSLSYDQSKSKVLISKSDIETHLAAAKTNAAITPDAFSAIGATFTTSQVFPADATTVYPYSTVGALFFSDDGGNYFCSASVIGPRTVATAGHCIATTYNASTQEPAHFHSNFYFVPAFRNGTAPFGGFTPYWGITTGTWFYSDGSVPNAQDVGLLTMNDRYGYKLGQYVGWLGFWTGQLSYNNVTMLGYPCNLDGCELLESNHAQTYEYGGNNTWIFGSNFGPGSSGCPYIKDFGWAPYGSLTTEGGNWLIAVNSYGPIDLGYLYSGASDLDDEFLNLISAACSAGGC